MNKLKLYPKPSTSQPMNPQPMNPIDECEFGEILECFHRDFHRSDQAITQDEDAKLLAVFQELTANYVPYLTVTQWIKVLGELVAGLYIDPGFVIPDMTQSTTIAITA